jgi:hypothetical protein
MLEGKDFRFLNRVFESLILKNGKKLKQTIEEISEETNVKSDFIKTILLKAKNRNIVSFYNSKFLVLPETFLLIKIFTEEEEDGNGGN